MPVLLPARRALVEMIPQRGVGAEVGVFKGNLSVELLRVTDPAQLHLIDPWISVDDETHREALYGTANRSQADMDQIHAAVASRFAAEIAAGRVVIHRDFSAAVLTAMPDRSLDWVYVDGDHAYGNVISDLRLSLLKLKPGGHICGDDYSVDGWWRDDVVRALHDFLHEAGSRVRIRSVVDTQFMLVVAE